MINSNKINSKNTKSLIYPLEFQRIILLNLVILLLIPIVSSENINTTNTIDTTDITNTTNTKLSNVTIIYQCPPDKGLSDSGVLALQILLVYIGTVVLLVVFETFFIINIVPRNMKITYTHRLLVIPFIYIMLHIFIKHYCYSNRIHSENDIENDIEMNNSSSSSKYQKNGEKENGGKDDGGKDDGGKENCQTLTKYYEKFLTLIHSNKESSAA